jgi:hypothetical protein
MNNPAGAGGGAGGAGGGGGPVGGAGSVGGVGPLSGHQVTIFLNQFKSAIVMAIAEKGQGPASITYHEILGQGKTYATGPRVLEILFEHKCNQPTLGIGSTAITISQNGVVSYTPTLQLLLR